MSTTATLEDQLALVDAELHNALMGTTKWNETRIPVIKGTFTRLLKNVTLLTSCLLYTSPSPRDQRGSRMPSSA